MVIAIDVDDTLGDFGSAFIKYIKKEKGQDVTIQSLKTEEWWRAWGETLDQANEIIFEFLHSEAVMQMEPRDGAVRALKLMKQAGHKLYVITGRPAAVHDRTKTWVRDELPEVFEDIYCTDFHIMNHGKETKGSIAREIGASFLVDDFPGYAKECVQKGIDVLLFESFWNHGYQPEKGVTRVNNWDEALEELGIAKHE